MHFVSSVCWAARNLHEQSKFTSISSESSQDQGEWEFGKTKYAELLSLKTCLLNNSVTKLY
jgi:hypothetical protein